MTLKLGRLPDRKTVKVSFVASPELYAALADLIPFMLEAFRNADPGFRRARKALRSDKPSRDPFR